MKTPHTSPVNPEALSADEDMLFVTDWVIDLRDQHLNPADRAAEEQQVIDFVKGIEADEALVRATDVLVNSLRTKSPELRALIKERDDRVFGHTIAEVEPSRIVTGGERLLSGENVAVVLRAGTYQDLEAEIVEPLKQKLHLSQKGKAISFPNEGMKKLGINSSSLHVDSDPKGEGRFPYSLSVSAVDEGSVLFIAGLSQRRVRGWSEAEYTQRKSLLNQAPSVLHLYNEAEAGTPPSRRELHVGGSKLEVDLTAIRLDVGDVVIWPQGGGDAERAAWHALRQIGDTPRTTTTRHLIKQS